MPSLPFRKLYFENRLTRPLHLQIRRRDGRLTILVWSRQPNQGERRPGIQTILVDGQSQRVIEANEFRGKIVIESADRPPCELSYVAFERVRRDFEGKIAYDPDSGLISVVFETLAKAN